MPIVTPKHPPSRKVSLIRGDGIGPEIAAAVVDILAAAGADLEWEEVEAGLGCIDKHNVGITPEGLAVLKRNKIALKGPTTTPVGGGHASINVSLRNTLGLFVNVRPTRSIPGVQTPFGGVDLIVVRENLEDTYSGIEYRLSEDYSVSYRIATHSEAVRTHKYAFELAQREGRKRVTCVHKANIMKITDGLWLDAFREVAAAYPQIASDDIIVDNCCMQLVRKPEQFDVLVLPNLFGDIVSDLCAGLVGGLGVAAGANIGEDGAIFEAVHGSAPDIAGKGLANPTALLLSSLAMLKHMNLMEPARKIEKALFLALGNTHTRTKDLGGSCNTQQFRDYVIGHLGK